MIKVFYHERHEAHEEFNLDKSSITYNYEVDAIMFSPRMKRRP
jgi:hypothetical protein